MLVLLAAVVPTSVTRDVADTMVIALVIAVNTTLAVCQEIGADRAVAALARLVAPVVRVLCDDREVSRAVAGLLPEDLIVLAEGDLLPADSLLVGGASLQVHESAVTGSPCQWTSHSLMTPARDRHQLSRQCSRRCRSRPTRLR